MLSCCFWGLFSVKLSLNPPMKYQNKISCKQSQKIMPASSGKISKIEIIRMEREGISPLPPLLAPGTRWFHRSATVVPFVQVWNKQGPALPAGHLSCLVKVTTRSFTANTATHVKQVQGTHLRVPPPGSPPVTAAVEAAGPSVLSAVGAELWDRSWVPGILLSCSLCLAFRLPFSHT